MSQFQNCLFFYYSSSVSTEGGAKPTPAIKVQHHTDGRIQDASNLLFSRENIQLMILEQRRKNFSTLVFGYPDIPITRQPGAEAFSRPSAQLAQC